MNRRLFLHAIGLVPTCSRLCWKSTLLANHPSRSTPTAASLSTGIPDLDAIAGRIEPGAPLFIAAPPRSGRTTLALTIARHACEHYGRHVLYWGPHIHRDARFRSACHTIAAAECGSFDVRCTTESLDLVMQSRAPDLLIVDSIADYLGWTDGLPVERARTTSDGCSALAELSSRYDCAVLVTVEIGSLAGNAGNAARPKLRKFGVLSRAAQHSGRILLVHRPALYERLDESWGRVVAVESPRQCSDPAGPCSTLLVHDPEAGLYRGLGERQWPGLFAPKQSTE